jgi:hypothetical protein
MRARNLKPGFFKNADLAELPFEARLLFSGLWCLADRRGRLEDRPKQIKGEVLPHDSVEVDTLLSKLEKHGFILRYERNQNSYIQICNFEKHQTPHIKESESTIPAPVKHQTSTRQKHLIPSSLTPDVLTPDSPSLVMAPSGAKPYTLPDPKTNPTACLVVSYKTRKGVAYDHRGWDNANWGRCASAAKCLLSLCGDLQTAEKCMTDLSEGFDAKGLTWTFETLTKHAPDWLKKNGRTNANTSRAGLRNAIAEQQTKRNSENGLEQVSSGEILSSLRDRENS